MNPISKITMVLACGFFLGSTTFAADSNTQSISTEQAKEDYRVFIQQLKQLNSQYKQITGEISKVMKEEGVPSWDLADEAEVLEQGVTIKESATDMTISIELPGIKRDSIKVAVQDSRELIVTAEKKEGNEDKIIKKSIKLPSAAEAVGAKATYEDGVITLKVNKISPKEVIIPVQPAQ